MKSYGIEVTFKPVVVYVTAKNDEEAIEKACARMKSVVGNGFTPGRFMTFEPAVGEG